MECANAAGAARAAGYTAGSARNASYRLFRHPQIAARIAAIQGETARAACRNVYVLLGKLENVYRRSVDDHHFSNDARAVELQIRISGLARHPEGTGDMVDWDEFKPAPKSGAGDREDIISGNVAMHRSRPRPVNDN